MELIIISGLYIAILVTIIAIWKKNWKRFRKEISKLEWLLRIKEKEFLLEQSISERRLGEFNRNSSNQRKTFEDEIQWLELNMTILKDKLHKEQIDSNNKQYARDKWKAKFEALTHTVESQNNWKYILGKYKHNWKKIMEVYNNNNK